MVKHLPAMWETRVQSLGREDPLENEMATYSSTLAWKIPWTEEPGRLWSMGSWRVGHNWATSLSFSHMNHRKQTSLLIPHPQHLECKPKPFHLLFFFLPMASPFFPLQYLNLCVLFLVIKSLISLQCSQSNLKEAMLPTRVFRVFFYTNWFVDDFKFYYLLWYYIAFNQFQC